MLSKILQVVPLVAILAAAQTNDLQPRQAYQYGEDSEYYQGCYSSKGGDVTTQGSSIYQSSGNCAPLCKDAGKPVFAVSGSFCWCADLLPALSSRAAESMCSTSCPGIDSEACGGTGYYSVYINSLADAAPPARVSAGDKDHTSTSSTTSTSSSTSSTKSVPKSTHSPSTTPQPRPHRHTDKHSPAHTHHTPKTTPVSSTTVYKPMPSSSSTQSSAQESSKPSQSSSSSSSSTGKIVGIVVGVVGGIVVFAGVIAGVIFYLRRRRRMKNAENGHRRADSLNAFVASGAHMPGSLAGRMQTPSVAINDTRLDPWVMKENRRESGGSFLADSQDYSRRILKVTNPDSS